jgi:hypothetical protein
MPTPANVRPPRTAPELTFPSIPLPGNLADVEGDDSHRTEPVRTNTRYGDRQTDSLRWVADTPPLPSSFLSIYTVTQRLTLPVLTVVHFASVLCQPLRCADILSPEHSRRAEL